MTKNDEIIQCDDEIDIRTAIESLCDKRKVFHSEADFQFSLAWEIQRKYEDADVRLEYPLNVDLNRCYVDILVWRGGNVYPIELKYKTKVLETTDNGERFKLRNHNAQDFSAYDFVKDIRRLEEIAGCLTGFKCGFAIWLTNDHHYWSKPSEPNVMYADFSVHNGTVKESVMKWQGNLTQAAFKGRDKPIVLNGRYPINWNDYSVVDGGNKRIRSEVFKYALIRVAKQMAESRNCGKSLSPTTWRARRVIAHALCSLVASPPDPHDRPRVAWSAARLSAAIFVA